jgi:YEATS domain-containing protein 4
VQIRVTFVPESGEKPFTLYHHLKLHPWGLSPADNTDGPPPEGAATAPVHAWQYDEFVFSDPFQNYLNILIKHPPTSLPKTKRRPVPFSTIYAKTLSETGQGTPEFNQLMITQEAERLEEAKRKVLEEHEKWKKRLQEKDALLTKLKEQVK